MNKKKIRKKSQKEIEAEKLFIERLSLGKIHDDIKTEALKERKTFLDEYKEKDDDVDLSFSIDKMSLIELITPLDRREMYDQYYDGSWGSLSSTAKLYSWIVGSVASDISTNGWGHSFSYGYGYGEEEMLVNMYQAAWLTLIGNNSDKISDDLLKSFILVNPLLIKYIPEKRLTEEMKLIACKLNPRMSAYLEEQPKELQEFLALEFDPSTLFNFVKHPLPHIWDSVAISTIRNYLGYVFENSNSIEFKRIKWGRTLGFSPLCNLNTFEGDVPEFIRKTVLPKGYGNKLYEAMLNEIADGIDSKLAAEKLIKEIK